MSPVRTLRVDVHEDGQMDVRCWCEATTVTASVEDIRAGRTSSCGRKHCHPPERRSA